MCLMLLIHPLQDILLQARKSMKGRRKASLGDCGQVSCRGCMRHVRHMPKPLPDWKVLIMLTDQLFRQDRSKLQLEMHAQ